MREVINTTEQTLEIALKSAYGKCKAHFSIPAGEHAFLPIYERNQRLFDTQSGREIFIYEGDGALNIQECFIKYDFKDLRAIEIDTYLQSGKFIKHTSISHKKKIKSFVACLEKNAQSYKIIPPLYEELERELLEFES